MKYFLSIITEIVLETRKSFFSSNLKKKIRPLKIKSDLFVEFKVSFGSDC